MHLGWQEVSKLWSWRYDIHHKTNQISWWGTDSFLWLSTMQVRKPVINLKGLYNIVYLQVKINEQEKQMILIQNLWLPSVVFWGFQYVFSRNLEFALFKGQESRFLLLLLLLYKIYYCNCTWFSLSTSESKPWTLGCKEGFYLIERRWAVERRVIFWSSWMLMLPGNLLV